MFYERFVKLCEARGVSPSRAAIDAGLSKSVVTKWKQNPSARPAGKALMLLSRYFNLPVSEILGEPNTVSEEALKFALFGGDGEVTDSMYQEVLSFAAYVKEREQTKQGGGQ